GARARPARSEKDVRAGPSPPLSAGEAQKLNGERGLGRSRRRPGAAGPAWLEGLEIVQTAEHGVHDRARRHGLLLPVLHVPEDRLLLGDDRDVAGAERGSVSELSFQ